VLTAPPAQTVPRVPLARQVRSVRQELPARQVPPAQTVWASPAQREPLAQSASPETQGQPAQLVLLARPAP
jgi:hypothetical protein